LNARLCPNPLGELMRSADPLAAMGGLLIKGGREGKGREGRGEEGEEGRGLLWGQLLREGEGGKREKGRDLLITGRREEGGRGPTYKGKKGRGLLLEETEREVEGIPCKVKMSRTDTGFMRLSQNVIFRQMLNKL